MINKAKELLPPDYELIYLTKFGSELYGTNKEGKSDTDLKGIYLPSVKDLVLGKAKDHFRYSSGNDKGKNTSEDIDIELWSIHKFLKHLSDGDTGAIDMYFSIWRDDTIVYDFDHGILKYLTDSKEVFLTKNVKAFVGYALGQAQKYGIKGSRYGSLLELQEVFNGYIRLALCGETVDFVKTGEFYSSRKDKLDKIKHCQFVTKEDKLYLSVLGKMYEDSISIVEFETRLKKQLDAYGDRSKASVNGTDWKALSHAYRVIYQVTELLETGFIEYPLSSAKKIMEIKYNTDESKLESVLDDIADQLEYVQNLVENSSYPERVDQDKVDKSIWDIYHDRNSLL